MKNFFKQLWGSVYSNKKALNGAHMPYWQSLIVAVLAVIIALVPGLVTTLSNTGSARSISKTANASLDLSLTMFSKQLADSDTFNVYVDNNGKLVVENFPTTTNVQTGETIYETSVNHISNSKTTELLAIRYVSQDEIATTDGLTEIATYYRNGYYKNSEGTVVPSTTPRSVMILSEDNIYIYAFSSSATNTIATTDGVTVVTKQASYTVTFGGYTSNIANTSFDSFYDATEANPKSSCVSKWATTLDSLYSTIRTQAIFLSLGIYAGLDVAVILLMALIIMILTKLRSSQGEKYNYIQALKITNWSTFSPGVIALLIGFMITTNNIGPMIGFVLCFGVRSIFLGMKAANPNSNR
jgi:hypothetical protein